MKTLDKIIGIGGRKFLVVVVVVLMVGIKDAVGAPFANETLEFFKWVVGAYVVAQGLADGLISRKTL